MKNVASVAVLGIVFFGMALPSSAATVGYWRFEEATGDTLNVDGTAGTMTAFNGPTRSSQVPVNPIPQTLEANTRSFLVDGTNDVFSTNGGIIYNDPSEDPTDPGAGNFTLEAWVNVIAGEGFIAGKSFNSGVASDDRGYQLVVDPDLGNGTFRVRGGVRTTVGGYFDLDAQSSPVNGVTYGQWHHLALVRDGDDLTIFVDGVADSTRRGMAGLDFSSRVPYTIGSGIFGGTPGGPALFGTGSAPGPYARTLNGRIDEVRISNEALSPAEFLNAPFVAEVTWLPNSGDWNSRFNWSPSLIPNIARTAIFGTGASAPIAVYSDIAATARGLRFDNSNTHTLGGQGTLTMESNENNAFINVVQGRHELQLPVSLNTNTDVSVAVGGTLEIDNQLNLNGRTLTKGGNGLLQINNRLSTGTGNVVATGGTIGGVGQIGGNLSNNLGIVAPGQGTGDLTVAGNYSQAAAATLAIEIASLTDFDVLVVDGTASLSGALMVSFLNGFQPSTGNTFDVVTASSLTTSGLSLTGAAGFGFQVIAGNTLRLTFGATPPLLGDYNGDGHVDAADYVAWRRNPAAFGGNPTGYNTWRQHYGESSPGAGGGNEAVPEPSPIALLAGVFLPLLLGKRYCATQRAESSNQRARVDKSCAQSGLCKWVLSLCSIAAAFLASGTARAEFAIDGATFTEIFQDDFSGIGVSEGVPGMFSTDNGNGLNSTKWTWNIRRAARIERDGSGTVLIQSNDGFPGGLTEEDDVLVSTRGGLLSALTGASQWGYEVAFTVNEQLQGSLSSADASAGILVGKTAAGSQTDPNAARDASVVVRQGATGLSFDLFHSTGLILTAGGTLTPLATNLNRGQEYLLGIHHVANDQVNYYLDGGFVGTFFSNNNARPEVISLGDTSAETFVDLTFNSFKVGTTPGGPPVTEFRWFRNSSGNWNAPSNWVGGVPNTNQRTAIFGDAILQDRTVFSNVPITVKAIQFDNASSYAITGPGSINLESNTGGASISVLQGSHEFQLAVELQSPTSVSVAGGAALSFNNELNLNGKTLTKTGAGSLSINNALVGGGILDCQQGVCGGIGSIAGTIVNSSGIISPGNSPGALTILGNYNQGVDGRLLIEIGGIGAGTHHDNLSVRGTTMLAGELMVTLTGGFQPAAGDRFPILTLAESLGNFGQLSLPDLPDGMKWDTSQLYTSGSLAVSAVPEATTLALAAFGIPALAVVLYRRKRRGARSRR